MRGAMLPIGTRVRTLARYKYDYVLNLYTNRRAFISELSRGGGDNYQLLFEDGQTLAWYSRRQFRVEPVNAKERVEDALRFLEWINRRTVF